MSADPDLHELWHSRHRLGPVFAERVADLPPSPVRDVLRARAAHTEGSWDEAIELAMRAEAALDYEDVWRARAVETLAVTLIGLGMDADAYSNLVEAERIYTLTGDLRGQAGVVQNMGVGSWNTAERALERFTEALRLAEPLGDDALSGIIMLNLGDTCREIGDSEASRRWLLLAAEALGRGWPSVHPKAMALLATGYLDDGDLSAAQDCLDPLPPAELIQDRVTRVTVLLARSRLARSRRRPDLAIEILRPFLDVPAPAIDHFQVRVALADCYEQAGDLGAALASSREATRLSEEMRSSQIAQRTHALDVWYGTQRLRREQAEAEQRARDLEGALTELRQAHRRIRELSIRDGLTGLHNRQHLMDEGPRIMECASAAEPAQVALIDLDQFKDINDTFGHAGGDQVLAAFGALLRGELAEDDVMVRYGGEEFVVLRPPTSPRRALVDDLERLRVMTRDCRPGHAGGRALPGWTFSAGVVLVTEPDLDRALGEADRRMYAAKRAGGDQIRHTDADA